MYAPYFDKLLRRIGLTQQVPFVRVAIEDWTPREADSHQNVERLVAANRELKRVRGWSITAVTEAEARYRFEAYSVVRKPDGQLVDITPRANGASLEFIEHPGSPDEFDSMVPRCGSVVHPPYPTTHLKLDCN